MNFGKILLLGLTLFLSCERSEQLLHFPNTQISGRHVFPLYQLYIPAGWQMHLPQNTGYQTDTKLPLVEITKGSTKIAIHNFPGIPIPPAAQVNRWKQQIGASAYKAEVTPQAWGGFEGLEFTAPGVRAWAMELAYEHERSLLWDDAQTEKKAPYTIKVTGNEEDLLTGEEEILRIVQSFELIEPFRGDR